MLLSSSRVARRSVIVWAAALVPLALALPGSHGDAAAADATILLTRGTTYRARLSLSFFQCFASKDRIGRKLGGSGFENVRVFMSARELPADWPAQFRARAGACERYAEGVWARPTMPRHRPSSIDTWWIAQAPVAAARN